MIKIFIILGIIFISIFFWKNFTPPALKTQISNPPNSTISPTENSSPTVISQNLDTPWGLAFLPDGRILLTERPGRVRLLDSSGQLQSAPVATISSVQEIGEGGLLGITLHPDFSQNNLVYLYYTYSENNGDTRNRVASYVFKDNQLISEKVIIDNIPGAANHNGGRIKFGPDGFLYITTGDAQNSSQAQDTDSLAGKILRVTDQGQAVPQNPFDNFVYSFGHRNPQGLAWDSQNQLWATEHGRSGILSGLDELNLIQFGQNFGWPTIQGDQTAPNMQTPRLNSGPSDTWAPSGMAYFDNALYFTGLRGQSLYKVSLTSDKLSLSQHYTGQYGRIRDVVLGPDNFLYLITSNQDGRGKPALSDDRLIRLPPP